MAKTNKQAIIDLCNKINKKASKLKMEKADG